MFTCLPYSSYVALAMTVWDMEVVSQMGPMIAEGSAKLRVQRQNPLVGSEPPRARDKATQRVASRHASPTPLTSR
jgi:hypothetical protein